MAKTGTGKYAPAVTDLRDQITNGTLTAGTLLPSESQLMQAYDITRYSAREVLKRLAAEGLVVTVDGKGSFVRARTDRPRHADPRGIHTGPDGHYRDAESPHWTPAEKPTTYRMAATTDLALALGIPEHAPLFAYDRLLEHQPPQPTVAPTQPRRMLHRLFLPLATCLRAPALEADPFRTPDQLYAALVTAGLSLGWVEHVRAATPTPDDTTTLHIPTGAAVFITRRTTTDPTGTVLALEETRRNAADTQLTYTITPVEFGGPAD